jgi:hypothetical protein
MYSGDRSFVLLLGATVELVNDAIGHERASRSADRPDLPESISAGLTATLRRSPNDG